MPIIPIAITAPVKPSRGIGSMESNGETTSTGGGLPRIQIMPQQIAGLIPLVDCSATECRDIDDRFCCWKLPVFGDTTVTETKSTYENDITTFLVDCQTYMVDTGVVCSIVLQQCTSSAPEAQVWVNKVSLSSATYGTNIAFNSITSHPSYRGYILNWGKVLNAYGAGTYRIKITTSWSGVEYCLKSPDFWLREFDCRFADQTVKFDARLSGKIGAHYPQGRVHDLCGYTLDDMVRLPGFFGYEKINEYLEVYNEYQNGIMNQVRNEAVQGFQFFSKYWPKEYHDRLKIYGLMADILRVSDYNMVNSDYNIKQLRIIRSGNYAPEYQDKNRLRMAKVTVEFKSGIQSIIKSLCCPLK